MNGESFEDALGTGFKNGLFGLAVGTVSGVANGMRDAYKAKESPWSGKSKIDITAEDLGVQSTMERINNGGSYPHRNDGGTYKNLGGELPAKADPNYYNEYVHPTQGTNGPGTQRIIIGKGGEYYYSPDHYKTFIRFKY
jgi:guanyl-specific ribonuclease Sa